MLIPRMAEADVWVFATPVFVDGMSGPMKNFLDRLIPLILPFYELRDGHCRKPRGAGTKKGTIALVSNCGFWEMDNFDPLLAHMKAITKNFDREFAGALLRPHGTGMRRMRVSTTEKVQSHLAKWTVLNFFIYCTFGHCQRKRTNYTI